MLADRLFWIGLGAIVAAVAAYSFTLVHVVRGRRPKSSLLEETLQDVGLVCLGASLMFEKGTQGRIYLMAAFVVVFGSYVARRIWRQRRVGPSDENAT